MASQTVRLDDENAPRPGLKALKNGSPKVPAREIQEAEKGFNAISRLIDRKGARLNHVDHCIETVDDLLQAVWGVMR